MEFDTKLLHGKSVKPYADGATLPPVSQVSAFQFESAEKHAAVFSHKAMGYAYTRVGNPTVSAFEQRINELEGGGGAAACSSGMAAVALALLNMLSSGDEIVACSGLYGGTIGLFDDFKNFGITTRFVKELTPENIEPLINEKTRAVYGEVIGNPGLGVMDIQAVAETAHAHGLPLVVDNTTATPFLVQPISLGADIVVHSSSKYINGGGNSISGVIVDSTYFRWDEKRYPALAPFKRYGPMAYLVRIRTDLGENLGACLSPANAYMNIVGMETLGLRMERICSNAQKLAEALQELPGISRVCYPGLKDHPCKSLTEKQFRGKGGGILTFRAGSKEKVFRILDALKCVVIASNIGDLRTLAIHPSSTIFIHNTKEQKEAAGVFEDTVRVSVGIENPEDLIEDFTQAVKQADQ
ncbi:MAG: PLP-dependent transferase [Eubacterium sp.]|jgi:O-acetylhomoserine (thiol)-lyase|nr:PLP-dependent transferase [Eubacterium sp.]MCH4047235.1 PLP-dependent transferase [Eubacterium sp.]MCH4080330.1 PLP-dependent transferase [Eubacterium sp.]MCH4110889.1 PLP-dependent transferase [Eubacterium sp.]MCI1307304.1 PLP-dependent transferase [Eubacterium sp.]